MNRQTINSSQSYSNGQIYKTTNLPTTIFDAVETVWLHKDNLQIRIYVAILAKLLKLQRFDSINYLPSVRE